MQGLFRLQDNTPEAYTENSRDFQLMLRLYDCANNGVMFYIDSMRNVTDTKMCSSDLLGLLKTKIGFFSDVDFTDRELRYILRGFPSIIKYKGSIKGIREAVYMYMNANGISCPHKVYVDNDKHIVVIYMEHSVTNTSMLDEVFKYIIPAGYAVQYIFYEPSYVGDNYEYDYAGKLLNASDSANAIIRGSIDSERYDPNPFTTHPFISEVLGTVGDANVIGSSNSSSGDTITLYDLKTGTEEYAYPPPSQES